MMPAALERSLSDSSTASGDSAGSMEGFSAFKANHLVLLHMGFTRAASEEALFRTKNIGVDAALEWLLGMGTALLAGPAMLPGSSRLSPGAVPCFW